MRRATTRNSARDRVILVRMDPNLDAIAFLYVTVAHTADGAITGDEMRSLANSVRA